MGKDRLFSQVIEKIFISDGSLLPTDHNSQTVEHYLTYSAMREFDHRNLIIFRGSVIKKMTD